MPLPLIPVLLGGASLVAGIAGVKKGFDAKANLDKAKEIGNSAKRKHEKAVKDLESVRNLVNEKLVDLGRLKVNILQTQIKHLVDTIKRYSKKDSKSTIKDFESKISTEELQKMERLFVKDLELGSSVGSGAVSGALAGFGAYGGVQALAAASTGTAISSLSGAAATNATLAWLGGGSLAAGGFGIAGGTAVLGGVIAGPALAVAGFMLASKAENALTEAEKYEAKVDKAVAEIGVAKEILHGVIANANEMSANLTKLADVYDKNFRKEGWWNNFFERYNESTINRMIVVGKSIKALLDMPIMEKNGSAVKNLSVKMSGYMCV